MAKVTLAATQMACTEDHDGNVDRAEKLVRAAAAQGANIILIQELFQTPYFPTDMKPEMFDIARPFPDNPLVNRFRDLARDLGVVLPCSFFERANQAYFNSLAMIDADGTVLGLYRKSHIPHAPSYEEKYYFSPGDTGFRVWHTRFGTVGAGICWDQWFPEAARVMALQGADVLLYPTAIGSEPTALVTDSSEHWQMTMRGHAAANVMPVVASNRIGQEPGDRHSITFYGRSFITDALGQKLAEMDRETEGVIIAEADFALNRQYRDSFTLFRDRRPDLYGLLATLDGGAAQPA